MKIASRREINPTSSSQIPAFKRNLFSLLIICHLFAVGDLVDLRDFVLIKLELDAWLLLRKSQSLSLLSFPTFPHHPHFLLLFQLPSLLPLHPSSPSLSLLLPWSPSASPISSLLFPLSLIPSFFLLLPPLSLSPFPPFPLLSLLSLSPPLSSFCLPCSGQTPE